MYFAHREDDLIPVRTAISFPSVDRLSSTACHGSLNSRLHRKKDLYWTSRIFLNLRQKYRDRSLRVWISYDDRRSLCVLIGASPHPSDQRTAFPRRVSKVFLRTPSFLPIGSFRTRVLLPLGNRSCHRRCAFTASIQPFLQVSMTPGIIPTTLPPSDSPLVTFISSMHCPSALLPSSIRLYSTANDHYDISPIECTTLFICNDSLLCLHSRSQP